MSSITLDVIVVGALGRLGRYAADELDASPEFRVVARVGRDDDLAQVARAHPDAVALEVSRAGLGAKHAAILLGAGIATVIGTSGVSDADTQELDGLARKHNVGVWIVPNFSRGAALLSELALRAAAVFGEVRIAETHRIEKADAPSGTALRLARELSQVTGHQPPIESARVAGADATHVLTFSAHGETLQLVHAADGLHAYRDGILTALGGVGELLGARVGWTSGR